jgi:CRP/FNR family cyclic AMP-dependent transcriptional regulator
MAHPVAAGGQNRWMETSLLDALPEGERSTLLQLARRRRFARNEVVFHDGDPGDTLHLILKGHVAVRVTTPLGDIALVRVLGPDQIFGELAIIDPAPRVGTVVALDACETLAIHTQVLDDLRERNPAIDRFLLEMVVHELRRLSAQLVEVMFVPVDKRIRRRLAELAELFGGEAPVTIPLTQEGLAQLTGTTRPTANRILQAAQEAGLVRVSRGRIEVLDIQKLERLAR